MKPFLAKFKIGKQGLTKEVIQALILAFKNRKQVRVYLLKSATRDREEKIQIAEQIKKQFSFHCDYKIIGYTIVLIKKSVKVSARTLVALAVR